ncbi:CocE/NonD family hydrolase [Enhygromyxa salina]|uniref:CocE/NonD family hydrolase n=1 Tax=Enhygromyxa salina TaxID=215803 RepID=UPI001FD4A365|nr:CocE/NonD family hydrolase [Enhygromyxa salina]
MSRPNGSVTWRGLAPLLGLGLVLVSGSGCERTQVSAAPCEPTAEPPTASAPAPEIADPNQETARFIAHNYVKREVRIPMRDGATLFTTIYSPGEALRAGAPALPIMLFRTPYSIGPYGEALPDKLGPQPAMMRDGYIFVYQDVRGRFMSDGEFVNMTPQIDDKSGPADIDESSDTYDTIAWLLDNVEGHSGKVGQWGISYPGFYAAAAVIDAHPALLAVSPQAPIADWWYDDFHHHGAFLLPHLFNFISSFGRARDGHTQDWPARFDHGTPDGFEFFKRLGPVRNANERYFHHEIAFWDAVMDHPNYDEFWASRNLLPHLERVSALGPAVMTVGGWFDAEDLYGPLHIYAALEQADPSGRNSLVMGPWQHGGWARTDGASLGDVSFGAATSLEYQAEIERRFFATTLGHPVAAEYEGCAALPEAYMFETGANRWRSFEQWPPNTQARALWFGPDGSLREQAPEDRPRSFDAFISDPAHPVPFTSAIAKGMTREYMSDDQRFAARRADVLVYQTEPLTEPLTIAGPLSAQLWVSTDQRDADWIVKLIDVLPDDAPDHEGLREGMHMGGYQMMVRSEVMRGRFREDPSAPKPFKPNQPTEVTLPLQDVLHTFGVGHRVMVQVQSTWFPLVDLNPQGWVDNIYAAREADFVAAQHRVYRDAKHASGLRFGSLAASEGQQPSRCRVGETPAQ